MKLAIRIVCFVALLYAWPVTAPKLAGPLAAVAVAQAQERAKVWVNSRSGVYHCPGSRYYGKTKAGEFMPEAKALAAGSRPAYGQSCGESAIAVPTVAPQALTAPAPAGGDVAGVKVWVNTRSGVYHCPGSQYYGNTRAGEFMSEPEARAAGNRAAYGHACG
jgi:hypothetical protein